MIRPQTCPICGNELAADAALESDLFPFCTQRCRQIDLYRWSEGKYAISESLTPDHLDQMDPESFEGENFDSEQFGDSGSA